MTTPSRPPPRSRNVTTNLKTLSEHEYKLEANVPLTGTSIYKAVSPHGSHVYVEMEPTTLNNSHQASREVQDLIEIAEECCNHLTGYVIVHSTCLVIKRLGGVAVHCKGAFEKTIRIVPLVSFQEIVDDSSHAALNCDTAMSAILNKMLARSHDAIEKYNEVHVKAASRIREYMKHYCSYLDSATEDARHARTKMFEGNNDEDQRTAIVKASATLEQLHTHSIVLEGHHQTLNDLLSSFDNLHMELNI